jgi:hypothetical protein
MSKEIKTERRWLRSVIAASAEPLPSFPWMRGQRRKPVAMGAEAGETVERDAIRHHPSPFAGRRALAAR